MPTSRQTLTWLCGTLCLIAGCECTPERPPDLPEGMSWAGDCDQGAWVGCERGPLGDRSIQCNVRRPSGESWMSGEFAFVQRGVPPFDDEWTRPVFDPPIESQQFLGFDDGRILLGEDSALVPHGWIDEPAGDGLIRRRRFELGQPTESELLVSPPPRLE